MLTGIPLPGPSKVRPIAPKGAFDYGKQGSIEYKPNWGQPISETGEWQSQQKAQPASFDIGKILTQQKYALKQQFRQREKQLRSYGLSQPLLNKALGQMQQEWDEHMLKIMGIQSQLDLINQGVTSGEVDPMAAKEAQARLVLPAGVADAMFPMPKAGPQPSIAGTTPSTYGGLTEQFESMKDSVMVNPPGRGPWALNVVDPEKLKVLYQNVREIGNYNEPKNIGKVAGLNHSFINTVSKWRGGKEALVQLQEENPNWFGPQSRLIQIFNKKTSGVSPLAKSVAAKPFKGTSVGMTYPYTPKGTQPQTKENDPLGIR
jgi:hypothetical protein